MIFLLRHVTKFQSTFVDFGFYYLHSAFRKLKLSITTKRKKTLLKYKKLKAFYKISILINTLFKYLKTK